MSESLPFAPDLSKGIIADIVASPIVDAEWPITGDGIARVRAGITANTALIHLVDWDSLE